MVRVNIAQNLDHVGLTRTTNFYNRPLILFEMLALLSFRIKSQSLRPHGSRAMTFMCVPYGQSKKELTGSEQSHLPIIITGPIIYK